MILLKPVFSFKKILRYIFLIAILISNSAYAVIILDSTYKKFEFKKAVELASEAEFSSLAYIYTNDYAGSGSWIGNYDGHGYILTAAHVFGEKLTNYTCKLRDGKTYAIDKLYIYPTYKAGDSGSDFAIIRLSESVDDAVVKPVLYAGNNENNNIVKFMGYGYRGMGTKGQDTSIDTNDTPAAAEGLIEQVVDADNDKSAQDKGNYFSVWLPKEDGSIKNPLTEEGGITKPVSELAGLLGSGDSGGPAYIKVNDKWVIAGVNSNGDGNATYGDVSSFARVSYVKDWIKEIVPTAEFTK